MTLTASAVKTVSADLKGAGLDVLVHSADATESFEVTLRVDEKIAIWPGNVDLKVFPDKREKQAVVWADEAAHTRTQNINLHRGDSDRTTKTQWKAKFEKGLHFGMSMPEGTTYKVTEGPEFVKRSSHTSPTFDYQMKYVTATVVATAPANKWTFLMGTDENSQFISALPKRVRTVSAAHAALRPKGATAHTTRQGEWFFFPASKKVAGELEKLVAKDPALVWPMWLGAALDAEVTTVEYREKARRRHYDSSAPDHDWDPETDTSHACFTGIFHDKALYVRGYVVDDRSVDGRDSRHDPLYLDTWHRVVRNLEITVPGMDMDSFD